MLLTRKMLRDCWNNSSPEEKAATIADMKQQRAEDIAFEQQWERDEQTRLSTPAPPGSPRKMTAAQKRVALRVKLAARPVLPTLWYENEAGDRWPVDLHDPTASPPEGFVYQWSRFPTVLRETCNRSILQADVDACDHPGGMLRPDLGLIEGLEGRECMKCRGSQVKDAGAPWPVQWDAHGSRDVMSGDSSWPDDLVLAMVRPSPEEMCVALERHGEEPRLFGMDDAIILAASSCERCLNALLWRYGLDDGYPPYSEGWDKAGTSCEICKTPGVWDWLMNEKPVPTEIKRGQHYTKLCSVCGAVIEQCRCMSPDKVTLYGICDACSGKQEPEPGATFHLTTSEELEEEGRNADPAMLAEVAERSKAMSDRILAQIRSKHASADFSPEIRARLQTVLLTDDELAARVTARCLEAAPSPHQRGWEHRKEKDERAQVNIPPEHQLAWKKLKNMFKGTPHERAEQFMEYLEEHPGESDEILQQNADRDVAKFQREHQKQVRQERNCDKGQTKYEDAWYKEQERQTKEKQNLQQLKDLADSICQNCPTCTEYKGDEERVPFAASTRIESAMDDMPLAARIAARYKSKKKVKTESGDTATIYEYSEGQVARRNAEKAKRLEGLRKNIGNLRAKVKRDLKSSDPEKALTALAVALIDHTYERVGNDTSAKERGHVGVTGWQKSHISFGRGKATVKYTGKSGVEQKKTVSDKAVLSALRNAYEACGDDEGCLFEHAQGKVGADKINAYLEAFDVSAKDLRGFHANDTMIQELHTERGKGGKLSEDKKERKTKLKEEFKSALERTAEIVGHEPSTLRSQYLVPGLEDQFVKDGTIIKSLTNKTAAERVLDRFLERE